MPPKKIPRKSKYNNKKVPFDGYNFDSIGECIRYQQLREEEKEGLIEDLQVQPSFRLKAKIVSKGKPNGQEIVYRADFGYYDLRSMQMEYEDYKGVETAVFKIKKAFVKYFYDVDIKVIK